MSQYEKYEVPQLVKCPCCGALIKAISVINIHGTVEKIVLTKALEKEGSTFKGDAP